MEPADRGKIAVMQDAWLEWGEANAYIKPRASKKLWHVRKYWFTLVRAGYVQGV